MQNSLIKYCAIILVSLFLRSQPVYSQNYIADLKKADSLFQQQQYAESNLLYQKILGSGQLYSPQMLLKLAYIQEARRNYTAAMYYLHLYYDKTPNRAVLKKIEKLAQRQHFAGYSYSDQDFFQTQFNKYYMNILQVLLMLAVMITTILIRNKLKNKTPGETFRLGFICYLVFIGYYINFLDFSKKGIIRQSNVAIMSAPAAGASWLATATEGHKIDLKGKHDIWYETEWNGQKAYIRQNNILELP